MQYPSGLVTTIAGQPPVAGNVPGVDTNAILSSPVGLALDGAGGLLVTDNRMHVIRRFSFADGFLSGSIAGSGAFDTVVNGPALTATLNGARGLVVAPSGVVYIADTVNNLIRSLTCPAGAPPSPSPVPPLPAPGPSACVASTLAGAFNSLGAPPGSLDGADGALFNSPTALALRADGALLYVADAGVHRVRTVTTPLGAGREGVVMTLAGSGAAAWADGVGVSASFNAPVTSSTSQSVL